MSTQVYSRRAIKQYTLIGGLGPKPPLTTHIGGDSTQDIQCVTVSEITTSTAPVQWLSICYGYCGRNVSQTVRSQTPSIFYEKRLTRHHAPARHDDTPAERRKGGWETTHVNESREGSGPHTSPGRPARSSISITVLGTEQTGN